MRNALNRFLADSDDYLLLAMEGESLIGSLNGHALHRPQCREPEFLLYEIDVAPAHRNRGVGKALVNAFVSEARTAGASEIWVLTNTPNLAAMSMYQACGFLQSTIDDVMLSRKLLP